MSVGWTRPWYGGRRPDGPDGIADLFLKRRHIIIRQLIFNCSTILCFFRLSFVLNCRSVFQKFEFLASNPESERPFILRVSMYELYDIAYIDNIISFKQFLGNDLQDQSFESLNIKGMKSQSNHVIKL